MCSLIFTYFWERFRNHMFWKSFLEQNSEKCQWRCDWLFWWSVTKTVKSCKTGILMVDFRWLYINVETQNYVKMQKNHDRSDFVLTGSSQAVVFKNRRKQCFFQKSPSNRIISVLKTHQKMIFFDVNEKALQKGSKFDCQKCRKKCSKITCWF